MLEPPDLWSSRLRERLRSRGPQVTREKGAWSSGTVARRWIVDGELPGARWADVWHHDAIVTPVTRSLAQAGFENNDPRTALTYEEVQPGTFQSDQRIKEMDRTPRPRFASPNISRFFG